MKKRLFSLLFLLLLCFSLFGCSSEEPKQSACLACGGTKTTVCAICHGTGVYGELEVVCPGCQGEKVLSCLLCRDEQANTSPVVSDDAQDATADEEAPAEQKLCRVCNGAKKVDCNYCNGNGTSSLAGIEVLCAGCSGQKKVDCLGCNGSGYQLNFDSDSESSLPAPIVPAVPGAGLLPDVDGGGCVRCKGLGMITCTGCDGAGSLPDTHYTPDFGAGGGIQQGKNPCYTCRGNRIIDCPNC